MKLTNNVWFIEASDEYFDDVHYVWRPVPAFWVGSTVASKSQSFDIRSKR